MEKKKNTLKNFSSDELRNELINRLKGDRDLLQATAEESAFDAEQIEDTITVLNELCLE